MGLEAKVGLAGKKIVGREDGKIIVEEDVVESKRGEKRKFELDEDELLRIAQEERTKARKTIDDEKVSLLCHENPLDSSKLIIDRHPKLLCLLFGYPRLLLHQTPTQLYTTSPRRQN